MKGLVENEVMEDFEEGGSRRMGVVKCVGYT